MNTKETKRHICQNDGCARPAETGETYCGSCGLELGLYFRERREEIYGGRPVEAVSVDPERA